MASRIAKHITKQTENLKRLLNSYNKIVGQDNAVSFDEIKLRFIILAGCRPTGTSHSKVSSITGN